MTDVLEVLLIIFAAWFLLNFAATIWKRIKLYRRINKLKRAGAVVKYERLPFLSFFRISRKPEITVLLGKRLYLIRIFNGGGIGKVIHFASGEYLVRFSRLRTAVYSKRRLGEKIVTARSGFAVGTKVFRLPALDTSVIEAYGRCESNYSGAESEGILGDNNTPGANGKYIGADGIIPTPVLIFNPAPGEVSYVTEEKTSIKGAFTGDSVLGTLIFTSSTFPAFAERELRREKYEAEAEKDVAEQKEIAGV